jgi:diguanylate cyclase (GGDEF)-like protein
MQTTSQPAFILDEPTFSEVAGRAAGNFTLPILIVCASFLLATYVPELPDFFVVLKIYAPYFTLGLGLLVALAFKRGRALFAVLSLLLAYTGFRVFFADNVPEDFVSRTIYGAICIFVPLNLAFLAMVHERGALNTYGGRRLAALLIAIGITAAVISGDHFGITDMLYRPLLASVPLSASTIPHSGLVAMLASLVVALVVAVRRGGVIEAALAVSVAAFAAACNAVATPDLFMWFTAAGVILTAAVLQDSHRMAFRDELTGLPGRRALNEALMALDRNYTIAMLDVDHFKAFNDKWGHDVGDQVLKLVASRIQRVGGGGKAYRYGGEEFTIVFPGKRVLEVMSRLDALRKNIEGYKLRIRSRGRPRGAGGAHPVHPESQLLNEWISVTVSAGVAERVERMAPEEVIRTADQALYRAKGAGRNRVSR